MAEEQNLLKISVFIETIVLSRFGPCLTRLDFAMVRRSTNRDEGVGPGGLRHFLKERYVYDLI